MCQDQLEFKWRWGEWWGGGSYNGMDITHLHSANERMMVDSSHALLLFSPLPFLQGQQINPTL